MDFGFAWRLVYNERSPEGESFKWSTYKRILPFAWQYRWYMVAAFCVMVVSRVLSLAQPKLTRYMLDYAIPQHDSAAVLKIALLMVGARLASHAAGAALSYCSATVSYSLTAQLRTRMYDQFQKQSVRFFINTRKGEIVSRISEDASSAEGAVMGPIVENLSDVVSLVVVLSAMIGISFRLTVFALALYPLAYLPVKRFANTVRAVSTQQVDAAARARAFVTETVDVGGVMLSKLFGLRDQYSRQYSDRVQDLRAANMRNRGYNMLFGTGLGVLSGFGTAVVWYYGGKQVLGAQMTAGTLVEFTSYLGIVYAPITSLLNSYMTMIKNLAIFERVFEVLDLPVEIPDPVVAPAVSIRQLCASGQTDIVLDKVYFSYQKLSGGAPIDERTRQLQSTERMWRRELTATGRAVTDADVRAAAKKSEGADGEREWALQDVSLRIPAGSMCAIVGRSGAGKSSLLSLIPRLYDATHGTVSVAGVDVRSVHQTDLASVIGVVPQDVVLLNDTIAVNLRVAREDATDAELERACSLASIMDLVRSLPQGFDTIVGERGLRLSGGERQRIAIARAILRDPHILLLDEATSSLDSVSEKAVQEAIAPLMRGRTTVVIAHRLSTIMAADMLVVLDHGRVVETGTHKELLARGGAYATLYHTQYRQQLAEAGSHEGSAQV